MQNLRDGLTFKIYTTCPNFFYNRRERLKRHNLRDGLTFKIYRTLPNFVLQPEGAFKEAQPERWINF
jgi:hypothetical protein